MTIEEIRRRNMLKISQRKEIRETLVSLAPHLAGAYDDLLKELKDLHSLVDMIYDQERGKDH